ncbi:Nif11 family protein [Nostoc sp. FACHB-892]|uniref:Nif11-like leader peptide family natural product precursor n=1 Tax=Nostoc sp. FACHB-892 TaxID=2692843 RepID=UPI001684AB82|nr:Nif11-like leader peptide family natural product precursor [Nostoc sp. FACHB-892]MBD2729698.1 Nif11 family protein [Nostoc sp. FACHB-892]
MSAKQLTTTTTDLEQFYTEVLKDSVLQERLKAATDAENLSKLAVELGKEKGYFFTKEEVLAAMAVEVAMGGEYIEVGDSLNSDDLVARILPPPRGNGYS